MKVEVCYVVDDLGIGLDEVVVVARNEHSRLWAYPLERPASGAEVVSFPLRAPDESPAVVVPRQPETDEKAETQE